MLTVLNLAAVNDQHMQPLSHLRVRQLRVLLHIERGEEQAAGGKLMKKILTNIMGVMGLLCAISSYAQIEYNYLDFNFDALEIDFDDHQLKADGYNIAFTKDYGDKFLLLAGFKRYLFDEHDMYRMRQDTYNIGVGLRMALTEQSDIYWKILYSATKSDLPSGDEDGQDLEAVLGFRTLPFTNFEVEASLTYIGYEGPISLTGPELSVTGQARWYLSDLVSFAVGANYGEFESSWFGNFRISFDADDE